MFSVGKSSGFFSKDKNVYYHIVVTYFISKAKHWAFFL